MSTNTARMTPSIELLVSTLLRTLRGLLRRTPQRKLRLCESLGLGEKRLIAVVQFETTRYLVGATGSSITLLGQLPGGPRSSLQDPQAKEAAACEE